MSDELVVDSSAIVAMQQSEADGIWFEDAIANASDAAISAGTLQEIVVVLGRRLGGAAERRMRLATALTDSLDRHGIRVIPVDEELALLGAAGTLRFGGKPARLNYGDGFAYALAKRLGAPILCKGDDFIHTDIEVLRPPRI